MYSNINLETGIRYGIISANSLHSDVIDEIQSTGKDVHWDEAKSELWAEIKGVCKSYMFDKDSDEVADLAVEYLSQNWCDDEPVHEFDIDGIKGRTTWLGGALLVWIFESPYKTQRALCSPCVPNCGDLDSEFNDEGGYECYDVPPAWRFEE